MVEEVEYMTDEVGAVVFWIYDFKIINESTLITSAKADLVEAV
jgi:hypothetical protein